VAKYQRNRAGTRRMSWRLVFAVLAAAWLALLLVTPHPVNTMVDPAIGLEAHSAAPAEVRALLRRACFDCHSDETQWPWYSRAFPTSWLVSHDVNEGRGQMNLSRWSDYSPYDRADWLDEACDQVRAGEMPLPPYRWLHPEARLSDADVDALCAWTSAEADRLVQGGVE
jgi:mono/diheme cytochrome c family protein